MQNYTVTASVRHANESYVIGDVIELDEKLAVRFANRGLIELDDEGKPLTASGKSSTPPRSGRPTKTKAKKPAKKSGVKPDQKEQATDAVESDNEPKAKVKDAPVA